jgi:hypothetical protein
MASVETKAKENAEIKAWHSKYPPFKATEGIVFPPANWSNPSNRAEMKAPNKPANPNPFNVLGGTKLSFRKSRRSRSRSRSMRKRKSRKYNKK